MGFARITGTGSFLPGSPVSNVDLIAKRGLESSHEWIVERTGIHSRHIADAGTLTSDLAVAAAARALSAAGKHPNDIDLIVVASTTSEVIFPSLAAIVQEKMGITNNCPAFDVQAVCSGFSYALTIAEKFVRAGGTKCALVIGAEVFSNLLDWTDRGTCVLFGDGAGAVVVEKADSPGIIESAIHADGRQRHILQAPARFSGGKIVGDPFLRMDGQAVFKVAVNAIASVAEEVLSNAGIEASELDCFIPHQANIRIIQSVAKRLGVPESKCVTTVSIHGNTSAASIPLALDHAMRAGDLTCGKVALLIGVGGGFTWGANLLRM